MKKILLILAVFLCSSFVVQWPCHPNGDIGPCTHRLHIYDQGACGHFDSWGYRIHAYDNYPCGHPVHINGDVYPCTHYCY